MCICANIRDNRNASAMQLSGVVIWRGTRADLVTRLGEGSEPSGVCYADENEVPQLPGLRTIRFLFTTLLWSKVVEVEVSGWKWK